MIRLAAMQAFHAVRFDGEIYDTGSKLGFLTANVAYALKRPELAEAFRAELKKLLG
jgi:UTP--glucose-1-phosphate uridylyltransferase